MLGCKLPLAACSLPPPANGSVGLRQLFVKRSCVDASLTWFRARRSRVTALPRACQGRTGLAEIQGVEVTELGWSGGLFGGGGKGMGLGMMVS